MSKQTKNTKQTPAGEPQLTPVENYDTNKMRFASPVPGTVPNSTPPIVFRRVNISTVYPDGTVGELILPTTELFSYGVAENKDQATQAVNGYQLSLCLWNKEGATSEEKAFSDTLEKIIKKCKEYLLENKEDLEQYELEMANLNKFASCLYWKREKGQIVPGTGPTLYAKIIASKKKGTTKIMSLFFDQVTGDEVDAMTLLGTYCFVKAAIKIESIFIGSKISLQVKLYEADVRPAGGKMKRMIPRAPARAESDPSVPKSSLSSAPVDDDDGSGSVKDDDDDQPVQEEKTVKPPVARKAAPGAKPKPKPKAAAK